jgi:hypothetical protein
MKKSGIVQPGDWKSKRKTSINANDSVSVATSILEGRLLENNDEFHGARGTTSEKALRKDGKVTDKQDFESRCIADSVGLKDTTGTYWAVSSHHMECENRVDSQMDISKTELLDAALVVSTRTDGHDAELIGKSIEVFKVAEHTGSRALFSEKVESIIEEPTSQQPWIGVDDFGKALRRSKRKHRKLEENKVKKVRSSKFKTITTSNNNAMANITTKTTTTTNNRNNSTLQIKNILKKNNKNSDRIKTKEQKSQEELVQVANVKSPMLLNLSKAITRAQDSFNKQNDRNLMFLRNPLHKNEADDNKLVRSNLNSELSEEDSDTSDLSVQSKLSYVSIVSSKSKNSEKADRFDKQHEAKIEEKNCDQNQLQFKQHGNLNNSVIRQSKRLSGEHNNFFEYNNKKDVNIVQKNKKIKIDVEDIETLEKLNSEKLVNKKINNIMRSNNKKQDQNIRINNYKLNNTGVTKNSNRFNKTVNKNNVNKNNNIKKFNNNSLPDKDDETLSQSSQESEGPEAEKRFLKNRLLIYDDIVVTYNRCNNNDEKSLLRTENLSAKPLPETKQNSFVAPLHITNTNLSNITVVDNFTVNDTSETSKIRDNIVSKSDNCYGQQRRTMMNKFMNNVKTSTSLYWKDDLPVNKNINNKSLNMNMFKNSINNKIGNKANNVNKAVNRKSMSITSNVDNYCGKFD